MNALTPLLSRQSRSQLAEPVPDDAELADILATATRAPDHGRLVPWRFLVVRGAGLERLAAAGEAALRRREPAATDADVARAREKLTRAPLVIVLGGRMAENGKIPVFEQQLAVAAGAMNVLNALHVLGYAGKWVTGPNTYDPEFAADLGFAPDEKLFGTVMAGTPAEAAAAATARADAASLTRTWS